MTWLDEIPPQVREFLANLSAESKAIWTVAHEANPTLTRDELLPIVREMYVRHHAPALFRVGVNFSAEQKAQVQALVESGQTAKAQRIILDKLSDEFDAN